MKYFVSILIVIASLWVAGCNDDKKEIKSNPETTISQKTETFILHKQSINSEITLPAELAGFRQVDLFAKVNSFVKSLKVDIGAEVREGQLLIELEAPEISSQLAAAQSRLHSQEAVCTASTGTYQRLFETSKVEGTISKNDLELAMARKNADSAQLYASLAAYHEIQVMQSYLLIRAPFNGKVTARNVNVGAYVGQGAQIPLLTVQDTKKLRLSLSVPAGYSGYLKLGDQLSFSIASLHGEKFTSKISRMAGALDTRLHSQRIEMDITDTKGLLLSGMIAEVLLPLKNRHDLFVVPSKAVITNSEGIYVIRIIDKKAQRIKIELGNETNENVEIFSDLLQPNDVLLSKANDELKDGTAIQ
jgi:membrane fusion protein, multidrug efflux system